MLKIFLKKSKNKGNTLFEVILSIIMTSMILTFTGTYYIIYNKTHKELINWQSFIDLQNNYLELIKSDPYFAITVNDYLVKLGAYQDAYSLTNTENQYNWKIYYYNDLSYANSNYYDICLELITKIDVMSDYLNFRVNIGIISKTQPKGIQTLNQRIIYDYKVEI